MIRSARLVLRLLREEDLEDLHQIFSNPLAMRYWDRPAWQDMETTRKLLAAFMQDAPERQLSFAIEHEGKLIGRIGMSRQFEIGYILHPDWWGKGLGTEAIAAFLPELFVRFPNADALTAEIDPRNTGSARVLEKNGFVCMRIERQNFLYGEDEWCDTAYYRLNRPTTGK